MQTLLQELEQINKAIQKVEIGGQEIRLHSRQIRRADLSLLYKKKKELEQQISEAESPSNQFYGTYVACFDRR